MGRADQTTVQTTEQWIETPEGKLYARIWTPEGLEAAKAPIIMLHDSLGCVDLWRDLPAQISSATSRTVITYDRLGFGKSDTRHDQPSLDFIAEESKTGFPALKEQLGINQFIAFGHSVGGGMSINIAARYPEDCVGLITIAAQTFLEDRTVEGINAANEQFKDPKQIERLQKYHGSKARWVLEAWTENWLHPDFTAWTLNDVIPKVKAPTLTIHGRHDEYGTTAHPELIRKLCQNARIEILEDGFHMPHREQPERIVGMVARFLESIA